MNEVGHVLMLKHPEGHEPSVMHSGLPNQRSDRRTNATITLYDKRNLQNRRVYILYS